MSASNREVAHRVFAAEYDDATFSYSESDEERAPNYLATPTGARVNRVFFVGVLTEVERVSDEVLRARIADPTGVFVVYAGQYQPDEMAFLEDAEPPLFVAVTGKARTFSPDDSDRVFTSVRPESINAVDAETRDRWTVQAAERTLARVATASAALELNLAGDELAAALRAAGVPEAQAAGIPLALDHYGTTEHYLASVADLAYAALEQVAGERDEVDALSATPGDAGDGTVDAAAIARAADGAVVDLGGAADTSGTPAVGTTTDATADDAGTEGGAGATDDAGTEGGAGATDDAGTADDVGTADGAGTTDETEIATDRDTGTAEAEASDGPATSDESEAAAESDVGAESGATGESASSDGAGAAATEEPTGASATDDGDDLGDFEPGEVAATDEEQAATDEEQAATDDEEPADEPASDETAPDATEPEADDAPAGTDDDPTEDVLDDEERERLEEEYGTFESGTEVPDAGEADIEPEAGPIEPGDDAPEGETAPVDDADAADEAAEGDGTGQEPEGTTGAADAEADDADETAESEEPADGEAEATDDDESAEAPAGDDAEAATDDAVDSVDDGTEGDDDADEASAEDVDVEAAVMDAMAELDDGGGADREELVAVVVDDHGVAPGAVENAIQDALMAGKCYEPDDDHVKPI